MDERMESGITPKYRLFFLFLHHTKFILASGPLHLLLLLPGTFFSLTYLSGSFISFAFNVDVTSLIN